MDGVTTGGNDDGSQVAEEAGTPSCVSSFICFAHVHVCATEPPRSAPQKLTVLRRPKLTLTVHPQKPTVLGRPKLTLTVPLRHLYPTDYIQGSSINNTMKPNVIQEAEKATQEQANPGGVEKGDLPLTGLNLASDISWMGIRQVLSKSSQADEWSDKFLEELNLLGEGAGGAVHKVRDKRTGVIMARKTITTREVTMKQLDRELSFLSLALHLNIVKFHAAYVSPSSSEIHLLMEFCEGGSLEAVGRRIRENHWRIGERVAGRLAEGVSLGPYLPITKSIVLIGEPWNTFLPLAIVGITGTGIPAH